MSRFVASLIIDSLSRVLLVRHRERAWELPGGHIEPGERPGRAAHRECGEEAGVYPQLADRPPRVIGDCAVFFGVSEHDPEPGDPAIAEALWLTREEVRGLTLSALPSAEVLREWAGLERAPAAVESAYYDLLATAVRAAHGLPKTATVGEMAAAVGRAQGLVANDLDAAAVMAREEYLSVLECDWRRPMADNERATWRRVALAAREGMAPPTVPLPEEVRAAAEELLRCAESWDPGARVMGNVTAEQVVSVARAVLSGRATESTRPPPPPPRPIEAALRCSPAAAAALDLARTMRAARAGEVREIVARGMGAPAADKLAQIRALLAAYDHSEWRPSAQAIVMQVREMVGTGEAGAEDAPIDRERLGREVRAEHTAWAREQPNPRPSLLAPWEFMSEPDKEVDRRIGERLYALGAQSASARPAPLTEEEARMVEIGRALLSQDNRATDAPIFIVEEERRLYGMDPSYGGPIVWINGANDSEEANAEEHARLEAEWDETGEEPQDWTRTSYEDQWHFVTACFTEQGCKDYLARNGHNHRGKTRIYAATSWRNAEFRAVRDYLIGLASRGKVLPEVRPAPTLAAQADLPQVLTADDIPESAK